MTDFDVIVIGAGPGGSSAGYWLAKQGHRVLIVEKKAFPRDKTCGDGLTPRAVYQIQRMGLEPALAPFHRYDGLRACGHGRSLEMQWPEHPRYPSYGYVVRRRDLDTIVANHAAEAGATLWHQCEAAEPVRDSTGQFCGLKLRHKGDTARPEEVRAKYFVVAEGANSRIGRQLGTQRNKSYPMGMAIRAYYESPLHADPWIESSLDVRDRNGNSMPGYGWIFPVGDGTINVGIGLLSTFKGWKSINTSHIMSEWAATLPSYWGIDPNNPIGAPTGGRLPMGGSIHPKSGPNWLAIGDAAGSINPFNGEGIDYAYETGAIAASLISSALTVDSPLPLRRYESILEEDYGEYFKVARLFARIIGSPKLMHQLTNVGMRSQPLMEWVLTIMANLMDEDHPGVPERLYQTARALVKPLP